MATELFYVGSFQRGRFVQSSNPLKAAWREVEKVGTVDSLSKIAIQNGHPESLGRPASLKVRQALELWKASSDTSILTRPLMMYYSMLNLTRGIMLPNFGDFGESSHGLSFSPGDNILSCRAKVSRKGTFRKFAETLGVPSELYESREYSLRDLFAVIPEMLPDFSLLQCGASYVVQVSVRAVMGGAARLVFYVPDKTDDEFANQWKEMFPWFSEVCILDSAKTLRFKADPKSREEISERCHKHLLSDLRFRQDSVWFDHRSDNDAALLPRLLAYIAAMFILSNVTRYEPEYLEAPTSGLNDLGFALQSFIDHAERFFPQLIVELLHGVPVFFE